MNFQNLQKVETPDIYKPFNEFVIDKSSDTFSNVAFSSYKKFGNKSPIISIEPNIYNDSISSYFLTLKCGTKIEIYKDVYAGLLFKEVK